MEARRRGFFSRSMRCALAFCLALASGPWLASAAPPALPAFPGQRVLDNPEIEVGYERLKLDLNANLLVLSGNVTVIYKDLSIRADEVQIDLEQNEAEASGNVVFWRAGEQWFGENLRYNFDTGRAGFADSSVDGGWVFVKAPMVELEENGKRIIARDAELTTCDLPEPHYHFKVGKAVLEPSRRFWIITRCSRRATSRWLICPISPVPVSGGSDRFSPRATAEARRHRDEQIAWTFNDFCICAAGRLLQRDRSGLGLRNRYAAPDRDNLEGFLYGYYLFGDNDNDYVQEPPEEPFEIEDDRWKIAGEHWQQFGERTTLSARYQFLSDREFNDDFKEQELLHGFERQGRDLLEYERNSFVNLAHRADPFNLRLTAKVSEQELFDNDFFWNDFPEEQRLPQVRIDGKRIALFDSPLYLKTGAEFTRFKLEQQMFSGPHAWLMTQEADRGVFDAELSLPLSLPWGMRLIPSLAGQASFYGDPVREFEFNDQDKVNPDRSGTYREEFDDVNRQVGVAGVELVERIVTERDVAGRRAWSRTGW
jgi:lipopolysaccharide assembly outer membrane protein LptD (OstA)